ncbi:MAG TPA: Rrf2 family transcriptional regulator [Ilumatobacter sp.]|nr:Rrf2 family transcriptional regulator [Ilumatobacter sp.]
MRISAKVDYAVRAAVQLAAAEGAGPVKGDEIAAAQDIPINFLENILSLLRNAGFVMSRRGADGGYWLAVPADRITVADIVRVIDGPLAAVRGVRPSETDFPTPAEPLRDVWVAVRASLRAILEDVTLADIVRNELPAVVGEWTSRTGAWESPPLVSD